MAGNIRVNSFNYGDSGIYIQNARDIIFSNPTDGEYLVWSANAGKFVLVATDSTTIGVQSSGNIVSNRGVLNFIPGNNISLIVTDDPVSLRTNVTIGVANLISFGSANVIANTGLTSSIDVNGNVLITGNTASVANIGVVQLNDTISSQATNLAATANSVYTVNQLINNLVAYINSSYTTANVASVLAQNAYNAANNAANSTSGSSAAFAQANIALNVATSSYNQANLSFVAANNASNLALIIFNEANASFALANSHQSVINSSFAVANTALLNASNSSNTAFAAFAQANTASTQATNANNIANIANTNATLAITNAQAAFNAANGVSAIATNALNTANSASIAANNAQITAQAAYNKANISGGGSVLSINYIANTGLTVNGVQSWTVTGNGALVIAANSATTTQSGIVQLTDNVLSVSTSTAATPNSVNTVLNTATGAFNLANSHQSVINSAFTTANSATTIAANANTSALAAFIEANTAFLLANNANNYAANAQNIGTLAFTQANNSNNMATYAYAQANSAYINSNNSYIQANNANNIAVAAFLRANTLDGIASLTINTTGGLTVNGVTTSTLTANGTLVLSANAATTTQSGVVQLTDNVLSTSITTAATPNSVNSVWTNAQTAILLAQNAYNKANVGFSQTFVTSNLTVNGASSLTISGNSTLILGANAATTTQYGVVQLNDTVVSTSNGLAATSNSVNAVYNATQTATTLAQAAFNKANIGGTGGGNSTINYVASNGLTVNGSQSISITGNGTIILSANLATTAQTGVVQLNDTLFSSSTTQAITANAANALYNFTGTDDDANTSGLGTPAIIRGTVYTNQINGIAFGTGQSLAQRMLNAVLFQNAINYSANNNKILENGNGPLEVYSNTGITFPIQSTFNNGYTYRGTLASRIIQMSPTAPYAVAIGDTTSAVFCYHVDIEGLACEFGITPTFGTSTNLLVGPMDNSLMRKIRAGGASGSFAAYYGVNFVGGATSTFSCTFADWGVLGATQTHLYLPHLGTGNLWDNIYLNNGGNQLNGAYLDIGAQGQSNEQDFRQINCELGKTNKVVSIQNAFGCTVKHLHIEQIIYTGFNPVVFGTSDSICKPEQITLVDNYMNSANMSGFVSLFSDYSPQLGVTKGGLLVWNCNFGNEVNVPVSVFTATGTPTTNVSIFELEGGRFNDTFGGNLYGKVSFDSHMPVSANAFVMPNTFSKYKYGIGGSKVEGATLYVNTNNYTHYGQHEESVIMIPWNCNNNTTIVMAATQGITGNEPVKFGTRTYIKREYTPNANATISNNAYVYDDVGNLLITSNNTPQTYTLQFNGSHYIQITPVT